jgi:hypothetical protein
LDTEQKKIPITRDPVHLRFSGFSVQIVPSSSLNTSINDQANQ